MFHPFESTGTGLAFAQTGSGLFWAFFLGGGGGGGGGHADLVFKLFDSLTR